MAVCRDSACEVIYYHQLSTTYMNVEHYEDIILHDYEPTVDTFRAEVLAGLMPETGPKRIPSKFFYDERGSELFREITTLDEYYLTRTEVAILREWLPEMATLIGPKSLIIEFGTGSGLKTKLLLGALEHPSAYVPIDISREQLLDASLELVEGFPDLEVWPVCADYTQEFMLPKPEHHTKQTTVFFPGSTIGNFTPDEAIQFLQKVSRMIGPGGTLLVGVDLVKDPNILNAAYNDEQSITAQFNLNLITHINREFQTEIALDGFAHYAFFNERESRIEMHLVSRGQQALLLGNDTIMIERGEHIVTEYSYKYTPDAFTKLMQQGGFETVQSWQDAQKYFAVYFCSVK
jgi:dimethylhistidine N-methyltransferase